MNTAPEKLSIIRHIPVNNKDRYFEMLKWVNDLDSETCKYISILIEEAIETELSAKQMAEGRYND